MIEDGPKVVGWEDSQKTTTGSKGGMTGAASFSFPSFPLIALNPYFAHLVGTGAMGTELVEKEWQ